jgi:endonuclease/exonuclease/phosphatase (EEP) superfamily protein YafD
MQITVLVLALLLAVASVLPFIRREAWWIRVFDFPRTQILLLALGFLGLLLLTLDIWHWQGMVGLLALTSTVLIHAPRVFPYTRWARKEVLSASPCPGDQTLSLLVANVLMSNRDGDRLLALIGRHRPDVVLLLEPDAWWERKMRVLEADYTHSVKAPLDNAYGMLLYSRLPLVAPEIKQLVREGVPSMHMRVRLRSGALVWLHGLHPEPPSPTEADSSLPRDAELLIVGREVKDRETPTIVAGDLNDVAWSYTTTLFQKISALLDPRKGRGMFNTFHAKIPFMRWPVDHVFHSDHFLLCDMQRLPAFGSDHFPVYVLLVLQHGAEALQEGPAANEEDQRAAGEKIGKVDQRERL